MRKNFSVFACLLMVLCTYSAEAQTKKKEVIPNDWHLQESYFGINLDKAYELLKDYTPKQKTVVAVIDSGGDVAHEDLKDVLWVNRGEIPGNGIDDDKNGYIDDINGWNFLGSANGEVINRGNLEADRQFLNLYAKYLDADTTKFDKEEMAEYHFFNSEVKSRSKIYKAYIAIGTVERVFKYKDDYLAFVKEVIAEEDFKSKNFDFSVSKKIKDKMASEDLLKKDYPRYSAYIFLCNKMSKDKVLLSSIDKYFTGKYDKWEGEYYDKYKIVLANGIIIENERTRSGFTPDDSRKIYYGNATVTSSKSEKHGTHVGGTIGANRYNDKGMKGIADVEIMFIRILAGSSDETDKDVAAAIRYAVDNGAQVVNMSFGKPLIDNKTMVDDAIRYAAKKNVLLVHAAGNNSQNIDEVNNYPTLDYGKKTHENMINIGASTHLGTPAKFSNYGKKNVHIFAPGNNIYATVSGGKYEKMSGTSMAAPVVSGVAALLLNYFPDLKVKELKAALINGGRSVSGIKVYMPQSGMFFDKENAETSDFGELSISGNLLNAAGSVSEILKTL